MRYPYNQGNILYLNYINIIILFVIFLLQFYKMLYWWKLDKGYMGSVSVISYNYM